MCLTVDEILASQMWLEPNCFARCLENNLFGDGCDAVEQTISTTTASTALSETGSFSREAKYRARFAFIGTRRSCGVYARDLFGNVADRVDKASPAVVGGARDEEEGSEQNL